MEVVAGTNNILETREAENLTLKQLKQSAKLRISSGSFDLSQLPSHAALLTISNLYGLTAVGHAGAGFGLYRSTDLRQAFAAAERNSVHDVQPIKLVPTQAQVLLIKFAQAERKLLAVAGGQLLIYDVRSLVNGSSDTPLSLSLPAQPVDLLPNPAEKPELVAVILATGQLMMIGLETQAVLGTYGANLTSACWSVKGKQIICGTASGDFVQLTPEGEQKSGVGCPPTLASQQHRVTNVSWLENDVFLCTYAPANSLTSNMLSDAPTFVILRSKADLSFASFADDPAAAMGTHELRAPCRYVATLRGWEPFKHLIFSANSASAQIAVFAAMLQDSSWATLDLDEASRPSLPASSVHDTGDDTAPLGIDIDLTTAGTEPAAPILIAYNSDGHLTAWAVANSTGPYPLLRSAANILSDEPVAPLSAVVAPIPAPALFGQPSSAVPAFGSTSAFGSPTQPLRSSAAPAFGSTSAFGAPSFGSVAKGFGTASSMAGGTFTGFAKPTGSVFGQSAVTNPPASTPSAFAAPSGSAFGSFSSQPTSFGGFGQAAATNVFGNASAPVLPRTSSFSSTGFQSRVAAPRGGMDDDDDEPAAQARGSEMAADDLEPVAKGDASASLGFAGFGLGQATQQITSQPKAAPSSPFGTPSFNTGSAFGATASAFGQPSTFGSASSLGQAAPAPTSTALSTQPKPSAFSATGQTTLSSPAPSLGGFGAFAKPSQPGSASFSFGSTPSPFGPPASDVAKTQSKPFSFLPASSSPSVGDSSTLAALTPSVVSTPFALPSSSAFGSASPFAPKSIDDPSPAAGEASQSSQIAKSPFNFGSFKMPDLPKSSESAPVKGSEISESTIVQQDTKTEPLPQTEDTTSEPTAPDELDLESVHSSELQSTDGADVTPDDLDPSEEVDEESTSSEAQEGSQQPDGSVDEAVEPLPSIGQNRDLLAEVSIPKVESVTTQPFELPLPAPTETSKKEQLSTSPTSLVNNLPRLPSSAFPTTSTRRLSTDHSIFKPAKLSPLTNPEASLAQQSSTQSLQKPTFSFAGQTNQLSPPVFGRTASAPSSVVSLPQLAKAAAQPAQQRSFSMAKTSGPASPRITSVPTASRGVFEPISRTTSAPNLVQTKDVAKQPVRLTDVAVPRLTSTHVESPHIETPGLAGEAIKMMKSVDEELRMLKSNTRKCLDFVADIREPLQPLAGGPVSLAEEEWTFGDLERLKEVSTLIKDDVYNIGGSQKIMVNNSINLRDQILAVELKREEALRYIRSLVDPDMKKLLQARQLGPEQAENRDRLRQASTKVEAAVEQLEEQIAQLKARIGELHAGQSVLKAPTLEAIENAIRNISKAADTQKSRLDELVIRFDMYNLSIKKKQPQKQQSAEPSEVDMDRHRISEADKVSVETAFQMQDAGLQLRSMLLSTKRAPPVTKVTPPRSAATLSLPELESSFFRGPLINGSFKSSPKRRSPHSLKPLASTLSRPNEQRTSSPLASRSGLQTASAKRSESFFGINAESDDDDDD